ncbi:MAG: hypothetical protein AB7H66_01700 [Hyphomonadaceae bacterium]
MLGKRVAAIVLAAALAACAELTAETPLFTPDANSPPPLSEGVWIGIGEGCPEQNLRRRRFAEECAPLELRRQADGAWRASMRADLVSGSNSHERAHPQTDSSNGPYRVVFAPAVEREIGDGYAPLYLGEVGSFDEHKPSVGYAIVAPIGVMPATEMRLIASIGCASILRDGPIEGVTPRYETRTDADGAEHQDLTGCVASSQAAVREAVRRALIENVDELSARRFVRVRPN